MIKVFDQFSRFSGVKPNKLKCEVAGISILKRVKMALCGMKNINLSPDSIKILGFLITTKLLAKKLL